MSSMRAIVVDPSVAGRLTIKEVPAPQARSTEALVRVEAISLNRGETRRAMEAAAGWQPGWDLAGTVIESASDGSGPQPGSRVVGLVDTGAWAEQVAVHTSRLAEIPASVTFAQAATLPVAGLTALRALEKGGSLLGKRILITGSTGGVGLFAHQLARRTGAYVVGTARTSQRATLVREAGADEVVLGDDISAARAYGPFNLIIESVGGKTLANALPLLASLGTCVTMGYSSSPEVPLDLRNLIPGTSLYKLFLMEELTRRAGAEDLALLAQTIAAHQLKSPIEVEAPWQEIGAIAQRLLQRQFTGKAVLLLHQ